MQIFKKLFVAWNNALILLANCGSVQSVKLCVPSCEECLGGNRLHMDQERGSEIQRAFLCSERVASMNSRAWVRLRIGFLVPRHI